MTTPYYSELVELLKEYEENLNNTYNSNQIIKIYDIKKLTSLKNKISYNNLTEQTYEQYCRVMKKYEIINNSYFNIISIYSSPVLLILILVLLSLLVYIPPRTCFNAI